MHRARREEDVTSGGSAACAWIGKNLSFPIAEKNPGCEVIGLDIVSDAIGVNRSKDYVDLIMI